MEWGVWRGFAQQWPCSISANGHDGRFADSKEFWRRILHPHANRVSGCQVYPVERSLHVRQAFVQFSDDIGIRSDSKPYAVHDARESDIGLRQDVNLGTHSLFNV